MTNNKSKKQNKNKQNGIVVKSVPATVGSTTRRKPPNVSYTNTGSCVISHTEYVADVWGTQTSTALSYNVNPQDATTFTWLSALATRYEMYKFRRLRVSYKPSCSTAIDGFVIVGMDFDAYDEAPTKTSMLAWKMATKVPAWGVADVNCDNNLSKFPPKYCDVATATGDKRVTDLGKLWVFTDGFSTQKNIGELYITYTIELMQPSYKIPPALYFESTVPSAGPTAIFTNSVTKGNVEYTFPSATSMLLKTAGKYLVTYFHGGGTVTNFPSITFSDPVGYPNSDFVVGTGEGTFSGNAGYAENTLVLNAGAVLMTLAMVGAGTMRHKFKISTFFPPN